MNAPPAWNPFRRTRRTALAWKNLVHDPRRLVLAASGVGFAALLMFSQNGFRNALLDSPVQLVKTFNADLVAVSPARTFLAGNFRFDRSLLRRAAADPDVTATQPLYIETAISRLRIVDRPSRPIRVMTVPDVAPDRWLAIDGLDAHREALRRRDTGLVDRKSRTEYGFAFDDNGTPVPQHVELADQRIDLVGSVVIGTDFSNEGTLLVSETSFADFFSFRNGGRPLEIVDLGLIRVAEHADIHEVAGRLQSIAPEKWQVMTADELMRREQTFWNTQTPVGTIFAIGTIMGFAVGVIICYQILYTSLQDAMPEFATLKAMGYPNRFFVALVIRQAIFLSVFGFVPAVLICWAMFALLEQATGLPMRLTLPRATWVLGLTASMCLISGLLALRKLIRADPASLF